MKSILKKSLGLGGAVVEGARIEGDSIIVSARPRRAAPRCPECGRRCRAYDTLPARRWRAPDLGSSRCYVEHAPVRVECPEHGVRCAALPWARLASSRFTSGFEDQVAWLALHMCRSALAALMRIDWHTVGGICARVEASLEAADGRGRLDGLRRIGVDETSYKKGHKYMTVVVDHDRGRVVWACEGHGKRQLNDFLDLLSEGQRAGIEVVTADGASWVADVVAERLPGAELAVDPFHAVSWATEALDALRREAWREARSQPRPGRRRGGPKRGGEAPADPARAVKGLRFPLLKNPEDLTERQASALDALRAAGGALWRGYLLKEGLRAVFRAEPGEAAAALDAWLAWACRSRIPQFVELSRKVRRKRGGILRSIELGVSNARVEAVNNRIKAAIRQGYGFRNVGNLIALVMLRCSDLKPSLPGRLAA
jgi:transposase